MKFDAGLRNVSIASDMFDYSIKPEFERKLRLFAEYGFEYVDWSDDWNTAILYSKEIMEFYRQCIESCGLRCIGVHGASSSSINVEAEDDQMFNKYVELLKNRVEFCSLVSGTVLVIHPPNVEGDSVRASRKLERSLRAFEGVRPLCGDLGISLAVENCYPSDAESLEYYLRGIRQSLWASVSILVTLMLTGTSIACWGSRIDSRRCIFMTMVEERMIISLPFLGRLIGNG